MVVCTAGAIAAIAIYKNNHKKASEAAQVVQDLMQPTNNNAMHNIRKCWSELIEQAQKNHEAVQDGYGSFTIPVDVYCSADKIRFAWLVSDDVTAIAGKVQFEIQASGYNSFGDEYLWKTKSNDKGKYFGVYGHYTTGIYGFYTAQEPDRIIFSWGEQPRYFCMPWTLKVVKSEYIGEESKLVDRPYTRKHTNVFYGEIDYWVKRNTLRRVIWGKIEWFDRYEFIVYTNIKPTDSNQTFTFSTDSNVCIPEQIDLQLLMFDEENF